MATLSRAVPRPIEHRRDDAPRRVDRAGAHAPKGPSSAAAGILALQRSHGNRHLQRVVAGWRSPDLQAIAYRPVPAAPIRGIQRDAGDRASTKGWSGKDVKGTSANARPRLVGKVWRIPIQGLQGVGNQDAALEAKDFLTHAQTEERAADRAIVLIPDALDPTAPIEVLLHLHGHGLGYREFRANGQAQVRDEAIDKTEEQLQAIQAGGRNIIAVLPQGTGRSGFGPGFDANAYLQAVFTILSDRGDLPKGTEPGPVVFSGHSGGGDVISPMLAEDLALEKRAKNAKLAEKGASRLPENMRELILFDALHGNEDQVLITFLTARLDHDLAELTNPDRAHWPAAHRAYLATSFRFRGYHSGGTGNDKGDGTDRRSGYGRRYDNVKRALDQWFAAHKDILGGPGEVAYDGLRANYQVIDTGRPGTSAGHERMMGENRLFEDALKPGASPAAVQPRRGPSPVQRVDGAQATIDRRVTIPAGAIPASRLGDYGSADATRFRRRVYQSQLEWYAANRAGEFTTGPAAGDLEEVEDGFQLHTVAAADCRNLLAQARQDRDAQKAAAKAKKRRERTRDDRLVLGAGSIGIASAYRSMNNDFSAWRNAFDTHYERTREERAAMPGGEFGDAAVRHMVSAMAIKAIPGFSNHTRGLAVDFSTTQGGEGLGPRSAQKEAWRGSWLYKWLVANAAGYGFTQLPSEEWHWDHTPPAP